MVEMEGGEGENGEGWSGATPASCRLASNIYLEQVKSEEGPHSRGGSNCEAG